MYGRFGHMNLSVKPEHPNALYEGSSQPQQQQKSKDKLALRKAKAM
jgi:hypothetical protein